ncbi:D,D-heptose 1,7-bisphosphate phosphatase [Methyloglobulus morosus KoM1]|uniref:D,D-heptose 1,7-bisphosphate phosphatase n=1 Tax=Methyloglobulus morosus KoM1 TaxID=1116472 RepID=V5DW97_9GAMM|nr:HAD family hydrolase [Methyloglobulus morosus]ESS71611.1 D,D-heptose 1,7-bisphosphate phosphatase [Methyloglobulus morosus KoM1]
MSLATTPKARAIFLDRDGVLNRALVREGKPYPPRDLAEIEILPKVPEALLALKEAGFILITVSNQPDVARGTLRRDTVDSINAYLGERMAMDRFIMCYHDSSDECPCRKPKPGMLLEGALEFNIDLSRSYMIGDRWRDVEAGKNAGCKTVFIDYGYDERQPESCDFVTRSLFEAAQIILSTEKGREDC